MKRTDIVIGDILVHEKDSYASGKPVLALDTVLWTDGRDWVEDPEKPGYRMEVRVVRPAKTGERAGQGGYGNGYRSTGIPVLMIEHGYYRWMDSSTGENRIATPAGDILRTAVKQLGFDSSEAMLSQRAKGEGSPMTHVVAETADGKKISVTVRLVMARPQVLRGAWNTFLNGKNVEERAALEYRAKKEAEEARRQGVSSEVADRLDKILGEDRRHFGGQDRSDCYRREGGFQISEATLLELLRLAEKGLR